MRTSAMPRTQVKRHKTLNHSSTTSYPGLSGSCHDGLYRPWRQVFMILCRTIPDDRVYTSYLSRTEKIDSNGGNMRAPPTRRTSASSKRAQ